MDVFNSCKRLFYSEWKNLKSKHAKYVQVIDELKEDQSSCLQSIKHCRSYIRYLNTELPLLKAKADDEEQLKELEDLELDLQVKETVLREMNDVLPRQPGIYLRIVLGALDISFLSKEDKFMYKTNYEHFKIVVSGISAIMAFLLYFFIQNRVVDTVFHFLLVWYYCTLTIRERILIANGSRIKGWWNIYHFISTANAGIMLIWPGSRSYNDFRDQFMLFSLYLNFVHCIQYQYQSSCLYKLRALGGRHLMDISVDGFMSWMYRRLTFVLPFLFCAYAFEASNAYRLYSIYQQDYCNEWQVLAVAVIYLVLCIGNTTTACRVLHQKLFSPPPPAFRHQLRKKYSFSPVIEEPSPGDVPSLVTSEGVTGAAGDTTVKSRC